MRAIRVNWASTCARSMGSQYERLSGCVAEISTFNVQPVCARHEPFQNTSAYMFTGHERMTGGVLAAGQGRYNVRRRKERGYKSTEREGPTFALAIMLSDFRSWGNTTVSRFC
jgi:hypothetical protein